LWEVRKVRGRNTFVDERKGKPEVVGDGSGAFGAACVGADNDGFAVVRDLLLDVPLQERASVEVVDCGRNG
jgi:hypothetical protein